MTTFFILMVDGQCLRIDSESQHKAFDIASDRLGYESDFEFLDDLNLCEWKDDEFRYIQDFANGTITKFDVATPYQLESHTKRTKIKKPTRQLAEEFDDIDLS